MKQYKFWGKNLEHCLEIASSELHISKDKLKYEIISNKASIFKKTFNIVVYVEAEVQDETYNNSVSYNIKEDESKTEKAIKNPKPSVGTAKVENGILIINQGENNGQEATIVKGTGITLYVEDKVVNHKAKVTASSKIQVVFEKNKAQREINIKVSQDKLSATIKISYIPEIIYALEDGKEDSSIVLNAKKIKEEYPPKYTAEEVIKLLKEKGIVYGLLEEAIKDCVEDINGSEMLIASGKPMEAAKDDIIKIFFKQYAKHEYEIDDNGNMDFKSIGNVTSVKKGDILCERIEGKEGLPGRNIFGQVIEPKKRKIKEIVAKQGCEFKDKNTIIATIDGRPEFKGATFSVHKVHQVFSDVDIKTGNIHFIGDVIIHGDVKEGMDIEAGNSLIINSNVYRSILKAVQGEVKISGNVISSSVMVGGVYVDYGKYVNLLNTFADLLQCIEAAVGIIKGKTKVISISDGDIIRTVISNKYNNFRKVLNDVFKYMGKFKDTNNKVFRILQDKFSDEGFSNIRDFRELKYIETLVREKYKSLSEKEEMKADATFSYIQDSNVECSGDIYITGRGVYKSYVTAMNSIYFVGNEGSNVRGGVLRAIDQIRANTVGSSTGVSTIISVSKRGHIYCNLAHHNTKFIVGGKEIILEDTYRNVHCYLNNDLEVVLDKLNL